MGWKVEYCLNLPLRSISLPQPASSSQTDIISHIQIASVCSGRGSWLPFLSSVEIDFSQLSQPAFFWNLCKIYIYKNSVWFGEISLAHAASQALFGAAIRVMSIMLFWENGERQAIDVFVIGPHFWESGQSWPGPVHLWLFTYLFPLPHSLHISICDYQ